MDASSTEQATAEPAAPSTDPAALPAIPTIAPTQPPMASAPTDTGDWRQGLSEGVRTNPIIQDTKTVEALGQRLIDTQRMVGNTLRMPTVEAGQETIDAFSDKILANENLGLMRKPDATNPEAMASMYDTLGRPENVDGYALVEGANEAEFRTMAGHAHRLGLSKTQFEEMALIQATHQNDLVDSYRQEQKTGREALAKEWGDAYESKLGRAASMLDLTDAPAGLKEAVDSGNLDADVLVWIDKLATSLGTEGAPMANDLAPVTANTVADLRQRRDELTQKMIAEPMSYQQQQDMQQRLVKISEQIIRAEGRE